LCKKFLKNNKLQTSNISPRSADEMRGNKIFMKVFAISDLHLSVNNPKPMDIFGPVWEGYLETIKADWKARVTDNDVVLLCGDLSWAMKLTDAKADIELLADLPGKKIIIRGNHDYWWNSISAVRNVLPMNFYALQNDCLKFNDVIFCGTRGWTVPEIGKKLSLEDQKILDRETIRLELSLQAAEKNRINNERIVVLMHFPPFNSDRMPNAITNLLEKYGANSVAYGHLHGKYVKNKGLFEMYGINYYLTSCDQTGNKLVEVL